MKSAARLLSFSFVNAIFLLTSGCSGQASTLAADPSVGQHEEMKIIKNNFIYILVVLLMISCIVCYAKTNKVDDITIDIFGFSCYSVTNGNISSSSTLSIGTEVGIWFTKSIPISPFGIGANFGIEYDFMKKSLIMYPEIMLSYTIIGLSIGPYMELYEMNNIKYGFQIRPWIGMFLYFVYRYRNYFNNIESHSFGITIVYPITIGQYEI